MLTPGRQLTKSPAQGRPPALITVELTQGREKFLHHHSEVKKRNFWFKAGIMLVSSPPPDTTPEIHQLKRRGCLGGHSFRLGCTGNWPSCFIQVRDEELHHDETHEKQRPSLYGSQNPKTKKKKEEDGVPVSLPTAHSQ